MSGPEFPYSTGPEDSPINYHMNVQDQLTMYKDNEKYQKAPALLPFELQQINQLLSNTFVSLAELRNKTDLEKITDYRRIAYQVPELENQACARSFEDAFILANRDAFDELQGDEELGIESSAYDIAESIGKGSKANFAIKYSIDETEWNVPKYIVDGLVWLNSNTILAEAPPLAEEETVDEAEEAVHV